MSLLSPQLTGLPVHRNFVQPTSSETVFGVLLRCFPVSAVCRKEKSHLSA